MPSFLGTSDLGGDGKTILLAIINAQLGQNYSVDDFTMGEPYTPAEPSELGDTVIDVAPHADTGKYGIRRVYYNRINIATYGTIGVTNTGATTVSQILSLINDKLGILLTPADIVNSALTSGGPGKIGTLTIAAACPVFYGTTAVQTSASAPAPSPTPAPPTYTQTLWATTDW